MLGRSGPSWYPTVPSLKHDLHFIEAGRWSTTAHSYNLYRLTCEEKTPRKICQSQIPKYPLNARSTHTLPLHPHILIPQITFITLKQSRDRNNDNTRTTHTLVEIHDHAVFSSTVSRRRTLRPPPTALHGVYMTVDNGPALWCELLCLS